MTKGIIGVEVMKGIPVLGCVIEERFWGYTRVYDLCNKRVTDLQWTAYDYVVTSMSIIAVAAIAVIGVVVVWNQTRLPRN